MGKGSCYLCPFPGLLGTPLVRIITVIVAYPEYP